MRPTTAESSSVSADVVDEADAVGLGRVELLARDHVAVRHARSHRADHVRADHRRDDAEPHLAQPERRVLRSAIAMSHAATSPTPPPRTAPRTQAIVGFFSVWSVCSIRAVARARFQVLRARGPRARLHVLDIGAGAEILSRAGQHDGAHLGVGFQLLERGGQRVHHLGIERVVNLGPVEHHRGIAVGVDLGEDFLAHDSSRCGRRRPL